MTPIAVFYHCLFFIGDDFRMDAFEVVREQMDALRGSGLADAATEITVGINGGAESEDMANTVVPGRARRVMHGLESRNENLTIVEMEKWLPDHPRWNVLYFHCKGSVTKSGGEDFARRWRNCMMHHLVWKWRQCVADLEHVESVGCHWMPGMCDGTQNIWAGNFWFSRSDYLRTLPSIFKRDRIHQSGIKHIDSRYEAEVWHGNGPRLPTVRDYHPGGPFHNRCP